MDDSSFTLNTPPKTWIYRFQAFFEVLLLSGLLSSFLATLLISVYHRRNVAFAMMEAKTICAFLLLEAGFTFFLLAVILRAHGETIGSLGLKWTRWKTNLLLGLALVPFLFIVNSIVTFVFRFYLPKYYIEQNPLIELIHTPQQLALFIFSALIAGGIKEEVQRAFILNRFRRYLGGAALGLVLWSLAFGFGHYLQGVQGISIAALYGFVFGIVYLRSGSLIAPIVAHGVYDSVALLAYWLLSARLK
jgi:membrane protease YdiL (CAAX protease family)